MSLIKIYKGNLVDARELHEFLGSKRQFANWIKSRIQRYGFKEGFDYTSFNKNVKRATGSSKTTEYVLTLNMAKELAMVENNEKGREARIYFIEAEETLNKLKQNKRLEAFTKLENTKAKLFNSVLGVGGDETDFIQIDFSGRKILFNGKPVEDEKLPTLLLMARGFATEITNEGFKDGLVDLSEAEELNKAAHNEVRQTIINNTKKKPEQFEIEKDINLLSDDEENKAIE